MKKFILISAVLLLGQSSFCQDKYTPAMKTNIQMLDSIHANGKALEIANNFSRIADAEKDKWLPYYYAAYATAVAAMSDKDHEKTDELADKASDLLKKAEDINGQTNSEIELVKAMIATAHMMVDPQSRYMSYGTKAGEYTKNAEKLDPANPRPVLFEAQSLFYTPEAFGGGKDAAKPLFDEAEKLFASFKPATELSPNWGKDALDYFLKMYK